MTNGKETFQAWIDVIGNDLPDLAHLRELVEMVEFDEPLQIVICGRNVELSTEIIRQLEKVTEVARMENQFPIIAPDRRYMLLEPELKPLRQDPFWTKQGKRKKGKRGRYK